MSFMTGSESQLLSASVGAVIALAGGVVAQWRQGKSAAAAAKAMAVQETLTAADDLLAGVRVFRQVRGGTSQVRAMASGMKITLARINELDDDVSLSFKQRLGLGLVDTLLAIAPGGINEQATDKDASYFQAMVIPARQRLTAAVSPLRTGSDRELAAAADSLVRVGAELADKASSLPVKFRRAERSFERQVRQLEKAATN